MRAPLLLALVVCAAPLLDASEAGARFGGGQTYSGSSRPSPSPRSPSTYRGGTGGGTSRSSRWSSSSSSSRRRSSSSGSTPTARSPNSVGYGETVGMSWGIFWLVVAFGVVLFVISRIHQMMHTRYESPVEAEPPPRPVPRSPSASVARRMRAVDKTFSEPVFLEWAQLLYTRFHEARPRADFGAIAPYLAPAVVENAATGPEQKPVSDVRGVVIGHSRLERVHIANPVRLDVLFRANWTATWSNGREQAYWVEEVWTFSRRAGAKSRPPELVERLGCPSCGSAAERTALGACAHCGGSLVPGEADWCLVQRHEREVQLRPPLLTGHVEEVGTDQPSVKDSSLSLAVAQLPAFTPARFSERARHIFYALQESWSRGSLEGMRPYETDALFSQHRFWVEEYQRQGLRNVLDELRLSRVEPCKVETDAYYDAITCRMYAQARDYTVRLADREVVGGNRRMVRHFTEYWTFIRRRGATSQGTDVQCPSCMASLQVTQTGVCAHCGTKLTRGDFDWVLSRIEQDEEYAG